MKGKKIPWKMITDVLMLVLLFVQMSYVLTGQFLHEWTGSAMVLLVICHNILNRKWYRAIPKGRYRPRRLLGTILNLLSLAAVLALFMSGMVMSRHVYAFLPIPRRRSLARKIHIACAYWGFILLSAHFGMHWDGIWGRMKNGPSFLRKIGRHPRLLSAIGAVVSAYGVYACYRHELLGFLLLKNEFAIFDPDRSALQYVLDHVAVLVLITELVRKRGTGKEMRDR